MYLFEIGGDLFDYGSAYTQTTPPSRLLETAVQGPPINGADESAAPVQQLQPRIKAGERYG
jgi:hypothetical protein